MTVMLEQQADAVDRFSASGSILETCGPRLRSPRARLPAVLGLIFAGGHRVPADFHVEEALHHAGEVAALGDVEDGDATLGCLGGAVPAEDISAVRVPIQDGRDVV